MMGSMATTTTPHAPNRSRFGWCSDGHHKDCRRAVPGYGVHAGTTRYCGCTTPGCACAEYNLQHPEPDTQPATAKDLQTVGG